ncbi:MAG TPA: DUF559 domain-containing protein [Longimicrobiales bacterium]
MTGRTRRRNTEAVIASIASRQHGVVTRGQLLAAGIGADVIDRRLKAGVLHPLHRGVYRVGPVAAPRAREMAACLACGRSAVVSHGSAAALWGFLPAATHRAPVDITITRGNRRRSGVRVHRVHRLSSDEVTKLDSIPLTTPARTLLDLSGTIEPRALEQALAEAFAQRLARPAAIRKVLARHAARPGARTLARLLQAGPPALTRSEAEERLLRLIRQAALDPPEVNVRVAGPRVDFFWREQRLVVEVDGFAFHASPHAFERDRRRDAALTAAGMRVMRVTWRQIVEEPEAVLVRIAQALAVADCTRAAPGR